MPRTESVGKKSVQSVVLDQGAQSDSGKHCTSNQIILEGESETQNRHYNESFLLAPSSSNLRD